VLQENKALAKMVDCVIKDKRASEKSSLSKLFDYEVDYATIELLEEYRNIWFTDPSLFHNRIKSSQSVVLDPWAQAVREHLQTEPDNV
jgi:hypothetical protein